MYGMASARRYDCGCGIGVCIDSTGVIVVKSLSLHQSINMCI